jgi:hypothetical protein
MACGKRFNRAAIQPPLRSAKARASFTLPRSGIVSTTVRLAACTRSV